MGDTHGTVCWTELMTDDLDMAKDYYGAICGWSFQSVPMGPGQPDYTLGFTGETPVVGLIALSGAETDAGQGPYWLSYFAVDDVDAAVQQSAKAGCTIIRDPFDIPGTGRVALLKDPAGADIGLMTQDTMPA